jgi:CNT family concentrative nucleoside transporter
MNPIILKALGVGLVFLTTLLLSSNTRAIRWHFVAITLFTQILIATLMLKTSGGEALGLGLAKIFTSLSNYAEQGGKMVFSTLIDTESKAGWGFIFAIKITTLLTFLGGLMSLLSYFGVIAFLVRVVTYVTAPIFGVSGAEGLCTVANSLLGQIESPLLVKNYLPRMTRSELMSVMISGFATTSITLLVPLASLGLSALHLFTSSIMSIPGTLVIAKILEPETEVPETMGHTIKPTNDGNTNIIDALASGATTGFAISGIIMAMLIVFIGMSGLCNDLLEQLVFMISGKHGITFDWILGTIFKPITYLLGIESGEQTTVASLIGNRMIINEFVAYLKMLSLNLSGYSTIILTYLLCGFANFSSIGMQIGAITTMAPTTRQTLSQIGLRAMIGGTLVNILNACIVSFLV